MSNKDEIGKGLIVSDKKNVAAVGGMNTNTQNFLKQVNQVLLMKFPHNKALAVMKEAIASEAKGEEELSSLELQKDIAKHFQATFIAPTHYVADTYHVRTPEGNYIVDKDKNVILGPIAFLGTASLLRNHYHYSSFLSSSYTDEKGQQYLYCFDNTGNSFSLLKQKHHKFLKPVKNNPDIFIINIEGESTFTPAKHGGSYFTPVYEHLIDRAGERISAPYNCIDPNMVASQEYEESPNCFFNKYTKLIEKNGEYVELAPRCNQVIPFDSGEMLFVYEKKYALYDQDNKLVKELEIVNTVSDGNQSPYVGRDEEWFKIIYEGKIYDVSTMQWLFPVVHAEDPLYDGFCHLHNMLYMKDKDDKLMLRKEWEFVGLENAPENFVYDIFYGQAKVYMVDNDHKGILVNSEGKVIDVWHYSVPQRVTEEDSFLAKNLYIEKRILKHGDSPEKRRIISYTGAVSDIYDSDYYKSSEEQEEDHAILKETKHIRVKRWKHVTLLDGQTCKELLERADQIKYLPYGYIYVRREISPAPNSKHEAYLLDKKLTPLLWPVHDIRVQGNLLKVTTYESLEMPSCTKDQKHPIDNATYYFLDLTPVGH